MDVFYDSKLYFWLMLEWMFFVFLVLHTETDKIRILKEVQTQDQAQRQEFIQDMKQNPQKLQEFMQLENKTKK
tara:strand:- start:390 stop:608 length:219 start_codon:yes stop_codon:yes gene_type:complete